jgi:hypothetical protein
VRVRPVEFEPNISATYAERRNLTAAAQDDRERAHQMRYAFDMPAAALWLHAREPDDLERLRAMTSSERLAHFAFACELARAVLQHRAEAHEVPQRCVQLSAQAEATWLRLCAAERRARAA